MNRCWGVSRNLRRCGRLGNWRFFCADHRFQPVSLAFFLVFTVGAGIASIYSAWNKSQTETSQQLPSAPDDTTGRGHADVAVEFVGKERLQFLYVNNSNESASQPKRFFGLWDITHPFHNKTNPGVIQPLPLAWKTETDFVFHNSRYGPMDVLDNPLALAHVKLGDRLFGMADVLCWNCARERSYWVYFEVGVGGWYVEMEKPPWGTSFQVPRDGISYPQQAAVIDAEVPHDKRIQMKER